VGRISVFHRRCDGSVLLKIDWNQGIDDRVWLEGDLPMVEFQIAAMVCSGPCWCGTTLATTAQLVVASFGFSPSLWWCSILLCVVWVVTVVVFSPRRVM
jgi:hypothetical protein